MKDIPLTQSKRIVVAFVYMIFLVSIFNYITGDFWDFLFVSNLDSRICFMTGAFLLILGNYIVEPFFTKPSDSIVNSLAAIIALLSLSNSESLVGYNGLLIYSTLTFIMSILTILLKDNIIGKVLYQIVELLGKSKVIFSIIYILGIYSYYGKIESLVDFIVLLVFWIIIMFINIVEIFVLRVSYIKKLLKSKTDQIIGHAIGCDNPLLYTVEIINKSVYFQYGDLILIEQEANIFFVGVVIHVKHMLSKNWIDVYLISDNDTPVKFERKNISSNGNLINSMYEVDNSVRKISLEDLEEKIRLKIEASELYKNINQFIGFVSAGSDINIINFTIIRDEYRISEGAIVKASILGNETLFQVINGVTNREVLEQYNHHGYLVGVARKLGKYDLVKSELNTSKWVPSMYAPVFALINDDVKEDELKEIANTGIGRLPNSNYKIPINNMETLVTHNTAILGILGIGKSCLAFELIRKAIDENVKIICIDITNQYKNVGTGLPTYINKRYIKDELSPEVIENLKQTKNIKGASNNPQEWGNEKNYKKELDNEINTFIADSEKRVLIINPDWHPVTTAPAKFNITDTIDLTVAEKTRIISERIFASCMKLGETTKARIWLVFEEAHSLIPEWNSVANEGDKTATNGTAKVILQGRKYGLGCLVITQRTANISKSILNQCNTIFALRVFDDTGKHFLENYIGSDYASTLPTLEERHAIAIGKGLKLKQPVIVQLNHKKYFDGDIGEESKNNK